MLHLADVQNLAGRAFASGATAVLFHQEFLALVPAVARTGADERRVVLLLVGQGVAGLPTVNGIPVKQGHLPPIRPDPLGATRQAAFMGCCIRQVTRHGGPADTTISDANKIHGPAGFRKSLERGRPRNCSASHTSPRSRGKSAGHPGEVIVVGTDASEPQFPPPHEHHSVQRERIGLRRPWERGEGGPGIAAVGRATNRERVDSTQSRLTSDRSSTRAPPRSFAPPAGVN